MAEPTETFKDKLLKLAETVGRIARETLQNAEQASQDWGERVDRALEALAGDTNKEPAGEPDEGG